MYKIILDKNKIVQDSIDNIVISPVLTEKLNGVPTLKYTIPYSDKYYQDYQRRISKIEVKYDDVSKFKGRLLNDRLLFNGNKELTFEGELAFLNDIQYPPYEFEGDYGDLFKDVLNYYNSKCDKDKRFNVGQITMTDSNNYITRSSETYSSCWNVISEKILSYGGYIKLRYVGDERYLDLLYESGVVTKQKIEFGENLLDLEEYIDSSEIATVVIPLGAKKNDTKELNDNIQRTYTAERIDIRSVNNGKLCIESKLVKKLGRVERVVNWDDVTIPSNLLTKAKKKCDELILENQSITAKAIDLHYAGNDTPYFKIGDIIPILSKAHNIETTAILTERTTYLNDPTQDTFSLGTEKKTLTSSVNASSNAADDTAEKITGNFINEVIKKQTQLITNGKNGNVLYGYNEKGKLSEICFMDTEDINTAVNVIKWNCNGLGFSTNGYSGPYRNAWTIDGTLNADFIKSGTLQSLTMKATQIIGGSININDKFIVDGKGKLKAIDGEFSGSISGGTIDGVTISGSVLKTDKYIALHTPAYGVGGYIDFRDKDTDEQISSIRHNTGQGIHCFFKTSQYLHLQGGEVVSLEVGSTGINVLDGSIEASTNITVSSDERLKENIQNIEISSIIDDIEVKSYNYINSNKKRVGVIAQHFLNSEYSEYILSKNKSGLYSVDYNALLMACIQKSQELSRKIDTLETKIKKLEGDN